MGAFAHPKERAFIYYAPYYLQSAVFIVGTLAWFTSELILRQRLPFWTETLGWALVFTNSLALILMNTAGLFLERGIRRNWAGLLSFLLLTLLLVPYQAYAAIKGLLEPTEGGWHRTQKTGVITEVVDKLDLGKRMKRLLPKKKKRPAIDLSKHPALSAISALVPKPLRRFGSRSSLGFRLATGLLTGLILSALLLGTL